MGKPVAWKLVPVNNCFPFYRDDSWLMKRAQFIKHQFWVTRYDPTELFAAGDYPNQSKGGEGLAKWSEQDRDIDGQDIVVWYTMGANHIVRLEDWPIMPAHHLSFKLQPCGFFDCNPTIDLPPTFSATSTLAAAGERGCCKNKRK
jgi:primary-amine oxidase